MKVLIADDELMECRGLEWMLRKNFPSLVILPYAKNGVELLRIVEESYPDLILMDIHMCPIYGSNHSPPGHISNRVMSLIS